MVKQNSILKHLYSVCSQKTKKILNIFQVKNNEPHRRNWRLSFFFVINAEHIRFIKPTLVNIDSFLTFSVAIKLLHWRERRYFINFHATLHVLVMFFSCICFIFLLISRSNKFPKIAILDALVPCVHSKTHT